MVVIEAMAAGVPVVGRDVPGVRDLVVDGETGVVAGTLSVKDLAGAIRRVVEDRVLREKVIEGGRRMVMGRFTCERVMRQYREVLGIATKNEK